MWSDADLEGYDDLFYAGQRVSAGLYQQLEGNRKVVLDKEDILPASLDGKVACYERIHSTWGQMAHASME
jgi:hypothetical protein